MLPVNVDTSLAAHTHTHTLRQRFISVVTCKRVCFSRFAYIEFADKESVRTAMALDESLFRGRQIKVRPLEL